MAGPSNNKHGIAFLSAVAGLGGAALASTFVNVFNGSGALMATAIAAPTIAGFLGAASAEIYGAVVTPARSEELEPLASSAEEESAKLAAKIRRKSSEEQQRTQDALAKVRQSSPPKETSGSHTSAVTSATQSVGKITPPNNESVAESRLSASPNP